MKPWIAMPNDAIGIYLWSWHRWLYDTYVTPVGGGLTHGHLILIDMHISLYFPATMILMLKAKIEMNFK